MSYIDELEHGGICPDCGRADQCQCPLFIDDEPYPEEGETDEVD